ncbi:MAG TPA: hypothetical protein VIA81_05505 [Acidimicrobiia bacterium]
MSRDQGSGPNQADLTRATFGGLAVLHTAWDMRAHRWWARAPFLPVPAGEYVRWRKFTAYGDHNSRIEWADFMTFSRWSAQLRRYVRGMR